MKVISKIKSKRTLLKEEKKKKKKLFLAKKRRKKTSKRTDLKHCSKFKKHLRIKIKTILFKWRDKKNKIKIKNLISFHYYHEIASQKIMYSLAFLPKIKVYPPPARNHFFSRSVQYQYYLLKVYHTYTQQSTKLNYEMLFFKFNLNFYFSMEQSIT